VTVSDAPNCSITYDRHYDVRNSFIIQATGRLAGVKHFSALFHFQIPKTECKKVPDKKCTDVPIFIPRKACKDFPKTVCTKDPINVPKKIPKKVCYSVREKKIL
jgi:hypothetical protein